MKNINYEPNNIYEYIVFFLIGGLLFCLLHYFSHHKNIIICSIIPALPILFLTGLFFVYLEHGNIKLYTTLSIKTIIIYLLFLFILICLLNNVKNVKISLLISLLFFFILYYLFFLFKIL